MIELGPAVALWAFFALATISIRIMRGQREVGLVWAYIANLWLLHWPAALMYLLPWYQSNEYATVAAGFMEATWGIFGFGIGAVLIGPWLVRLFKQPGAGLQAPPPNSLLPRSYLIVGMLTYLLITPFAHLIPSGGALSSAASQLIIVAICLRCWHGWYTKNNLMFYSSLAVAAVMPFATMLGQGFLGYGASAVIIVLCFNGSFIRPRWKVGLSAILLVYVAFTAYVTYMRDRNEIRRVIWGGQSLANRMTTVLGTVQNTELFNPTDKDHLDRIDGRLNQNYLVGASVEMLSSGARDFARGETLKDAALALVPRAIWPDKPVYAGSPQVVATYTGMSFAVGTSVGIGQVMEFYVNFGSMGVVIGFIVLGALIAMFDAWAADRLWRGDWEHFAFWFLAGMGFIQAGGSLIEVTSTVGAGLLTAWFVNRNVVPWLQKSNAHRPALPGAASVPRRL